MNTGQIFLIASIVGILTYARDLFAAARARRKKLTEEERAQLKEPIEIRGLVLENVRDVTSLQSALLLDVRQQVKALQEENELKAQTIRDLQSAASGWDTERRKMYVLVGKLQARIEELEAGTSHR